MHEWIINNPHIILSLIKNDFLNIETTSKNYNKSASNLLLQIYVRYLHNSMVWPGPQRRLS